MGPSSSYSLLDASAIKYAVAVGQMVALGDFTIEQGTDLVYLWPGALGTERRIDPRFPLRPAYWLKNSTGYEILHGRHTQLCWAMNDAMIQMERDLDSQEFDARKTVAPLLARGAGRNKVIAAIRQRCPDLPDDLLEMLIDQEAAWWLRWRHDHEMGEAA